MHALSLYTQDHPQAKSSPGDISAGVGDAGRGGDRGIGAELRTRTRYGGSDPTAKPG
jgi:hypothetical protein